MGAGNGNPAVAAVVQGGGTWPGVATCGSGRQERISLVGRLVVYEAQGAGVRGVAGAEGVQHALEGAVVADLHPPQQETLRHIVHAHVPARPPAGWAQLTSTQTRVQQSPLTHSICRMVACSCMCIILLLHYGYWVSAAINYLEAYGLVDRLHSILSSCVRSDSPRLTWMRRRPGARSRLR